MCNDPLNASPHRYDDVAGDSALRRLTATASVLGNLVAGALFLGGLYLVPLWMDGLMKAV